ncbi:MAG: PEP-CTERM sorting domain-containing protein [Bryobacterales bacterium]|nr:PEP-CTERM sorting domain-containing protein [Bryobacterales bacterium]
MSLFPRFAPPLATLLFLAAATLAPAATFDASSVGCSSDTSTLTTAPLASSNGNVGAKLYGQCSTFWESSSEGGDTSTLTAGMGGSLVGDPGSGLVPIAWLFSVTEIFEADLADSFSWQVWVERDAIRTVIGSGSLTPDQPVEGSTSVSFAGVSTWGAGITIIANLPILAFGSFVLDIPENSLDVNALVNTAGVPEPGSAVLLLGGASALLLLRRLRA